MKRKLVFTSMIAASILLTGCQDEKANTQNIKASATEQNGTKVKKYNKETEINEEAIYDHFSVKISKMIRTNQYESDDSIITAKPGKEFILLHIESKNTGAEENGDPFTIDFINEENVKVGMLYHERPKDNYSAFDMVMPEGTKKGFAVYEIEKGETISSIVLRKGLGSPMNSKLPDVIISLGDKKGKNTNGLNAVSNKDTNSHHHIYSEVVKVNKEVTYDDFSFKVIEYTRTNEVTFDNGDKRNPEEGKESFVLQLESKNNGKESLEDPFHISIVDSKKTRLPFSSGGEEPYIGGLAILPGGIKTGTVIYTVNKGENISAVLLSDRNKFRKKPDVLIELP